MLLSTPFVIISLYNILIHSIKMPLALDWICLCFFGLGIPLSIYNLFDRRPEVIINSEGIYDRQTTKDFIDWKLIEDVYLKDMQVSRLSNQNFLCLKLVPNANPALKRFKLLNETNRKMGFGDVAIALNQLKNNDWQKVADFTKEMLHADASARQKLLLSYGQE